MLPGIGALGNEVRYLAPKLNPAGYRAVAVDLRDRGESSVPWDAYDTSFGAAPAIWTAKDPDFPDPASEGKTIAMR